MDPLPLCFRQLWALTAAATRELLWGLRAVSGELDGWRARARAIPDAPLRRDALDSLATKRAHADGAALFSILPRARHLGLLRLLVAYQTAWDFLDNVGESGAHAGEANGRQLHLALVEALDTGASSSDYYSHHPCRQDGGYLRALVEASRAACAQLSSYEQVRAPVLAEAARCAVQSLNHDPDPVRRDAALREWAGREWAGRKLLDSGSFDSELPDCGLFDSGPTGSEPLGSAESWFELTAAASASLVPHVLLALAAEPMCAPRDIERAHRAYLPWVSLATAMLDSYADLEEDRASGEHSYIAHYGDEDAAVARLAEILDRAARGARGLRDGERHAVLVACVIAMYLSKDSARRDAARVSTGALVRASGSLAQLLAPVLRIWRIAYSLRSV